MSPEELSRVIANISLAIGGPVLILSMVKTIRDWVKNRKKRGQTELDNAYISRRLIEEYASQLRRQLTEEGIKPKPWPKESSKRK